MSEAKIRFHHYLATVLAIVLLTATLHAKECSNADFDGRYAVQTHNSVIGGPQDNWIAGTLVADGDGLITEWTDTAIFSRVLPDGTEEKVIVERDHVATSTVPVSYEVTPDCRIMIRHDTTMRPPDDQEIEYHGALANGGREVLATLVLPRIAKAGVIMKSIKSRPDRRHRGRRDKDDDNDDDDDDD